MVYSRYKGTREIIIMFKRSMKEHDIIIIILFTFLCIIFVLVPPFNQTSARVFLGLPFLIFLPGYSLTIALFPRRDDLSEIERTVISFGMSIIVVPLLGFGLNYTSFGIRVTSILILVSTFIISLSLIAWFRRMKVPIEDRFQVQVATLLKFNLGHSILDKCLSIILIVVIIGSFSTLIYVVSTPNVDGRFTEFYLLGLNGTTSDYPTELNVGEDGKMIIGIMNQEFENVTYLLNVNFNGSLIYEEHFFLIENEKLEIPFKFKSTNKLENQKLEFILYKNEEKEAYRTLHLWVNIN